MNLYDKEELLEKSNQEKLKSSKTKVEYQRLESSLKNSVPEESYNAL